jgi:hypothetical protein
LANFVKIGLSRGLRGSSTTRRAIARAFRDAAKILGAILLFGAMPALALQHGGGGGGHAGGGGGGGHFGGGGGGHVAGGGSHPSGSGQHASAPHSSSGQSAGRGGAATHPTAISATAPGARVVSRLAQTTHIAEPGYVWEATPGYSNRVGPAAPKDLGKRGYVWEEGPSSGVAGEKNSYFLTENLMPRTESAPRAVGGTFVARGSVSPHSNAVILNRRPIPSGSLSARPTRIIRTRRPIFFGGFFPFGFYPGFLFDDCFGLGFNYGYGYGFGYGYNPCGYGYFYPGYGYYSGGSYSDFTGNVTNDMTQEPYGEPSAPESEPSSDEATAPSSAAAPTPSADSTVLFLKDGTSFAVTDYWLEGGRLHYVTTYGGANAIELDALDTQKTVDQNAKSGVTFTLRPPHWQDKDAAPLPEPQQKPN